MEKELIKKLNTIKEINACFDEIKYFRDNYVFEEELDPLEVEEIDLLVGKLWLKYKRLYDDISSKL